MDPNSQQIPEVFHALRALDIYVSMFCNDISIFIFFLKIEKRVVLKSNTIT